MEPIAIAKFLEDEPESTVDELRALQLERLLESTKLKNGDPLPEHLAADKLPKRIGEKLVDLYINGQREDEGPKRIKAAEDCAAAQTRHWFELTAVVCHTYGYSVLPDDPRFIGKLRLSQVSALYEGATLIRFRDSYPIDRLAQLMANEGGGRIDETDPLAAAYLKKAAARRKKDREPRKIPYEVTDFLMPWETATYEVERLRRATAGDDSNPYERVPLGVLQEIPNDLDAGTLPSWFYAGLDIPKLQALTKQKDYNTAPESEWGFFF